MNASPIPAGTPQISVIVPVHNGARWLGETLDSLYAQSLPDFEVVLVDDASTDELGDVLDRHADARLRVVHLATNVGVSAARNHGIELARGRYVAFCDADDLCQPQRLARQWSFLEQHPEIGLCGSAFTCFDTQDRETVSHPETDAQIRKALMAGNCFGLSTVMVKASLLKQRHFDPSIQLAEDYELWTRLVASGVRAANLSESLIRYRLHPQQASQHKGERLDQISRQVRAIYCARLIGPAALAERLQSVNLGVANMEEAADRILAFCAVRREFTPLEFRFMLAWMYEKLPDHGLRPLMAWSRLQARLGMTLNRTYRINTALLALLPKALTWRHFDTLVKLKR